MATEYCTVEVWVCVDENGEYVASASEESLLPLYDEEIGRDDDNPVGMRKVKVTLKVPLPKLIELSAEVAADEEVGELKVL